MFQSHNLNKHKIYLIKFTVKTKIYKIYITMKHGKRYSSLIRHNKIIFYINF